MALHTWAETCCKKTLQHIKNCCVWRLLPLLLRYCIRQHTRIKLILIWKFQTSYSFGYRSWQLTRIPFWQLQYLSNDRLSHATAKEPSLQNEIHIRVLMNSQVSLSVKPGWLMYGYIWTHYSSETSVTTNQCRLRSVAEFSYFFLVRCFVHSPSKCYATGKLFSIAVHKPWHFHLWYIQRNSNNHNG